MAVRSGAVSTILDTWFASLRFAPLRLFGARIGEGVIIKPGVRVKFPWRLSMGDHCWRGEDAWIDNLAAVTQASAATAASRKVRDESRALNDCRLLAIYEYMIVLKMKEIERREKGLPV